MLAEHSQTGDGSRWGGQEAHLNASRLNAMTTMHQMVVKSLTV